VSTSVNCCTGQCPGLNFPHRVNHLEQSVGSGFVLVKVLLIVILKL